MQFSVIIPCHNAQQWIASTLASVTAQTHQPAEVIVVADRCTDDSLSVVRQSGLPIQIIETDLGNAGQARNAGVEMATSDWIALLDADDHWYPNHLADAATLLENSDHVAYCAGHDFMDNDGHTFAMPNCYWPGWEEVHADLTDADYVQLMHQSMHFGHSTVIYSRRRFCEVGGFEISQVRRHDIDLWLRMIHRHRWVYSPGPAAAYRNQTPGSISRNQIQVAYYDLQALTRNQQAYDMPLFDQRVNAYAKRAMSVAFHEAEEPWASRLRQLAQGHLSWNYRLVYAVANLCPPLFKAMIHLKRRRRTDASL